LYSTIFQPIATTGASSLIAGATIRVGGWGMGVAVGVGLGAGVDGTAVGVGLAPPAGAVGDGVGTAVGSGLGVAVAVMANTTAPASVSTGGGGASAHRHTAQPTPARISSPPKRSSALDNSGPTLFNRHPAPRKQNPVSVKKPGFGLSPRVQKPPIRR
jgi:hypothetical protein